MPDLSHLPGWSEPEPGAVRAFSRLAQTLFQAGPDLYRGPLPDDVLLYKAWKDVLGKYPSYPAQEIGDCCGFGTSHADDLLQCVQIAIGRQKFDFKEICTEAAYGIGREIAGMLGGGDGCYGGAMAKAVTQVGTVPREAVGAYSGERARQWGGRGGVPAKIKAMLGDHKNGAYALIKSTDDAHVSLANGYPMLVCSNWGFSTPRDSTGLCRPRGTWPHCMHICGVRKRDGRRQFCIGQSWGDDQPQGPLADDQPPFSFWIDEDPMASMIAAQDTWALSAYAGFPGQGLPSAWTMGGWA